MSTRFYDTNMTKQWIVLIVILLLSFKLLAQHGYYDAPYTRYEANDGVLTNASITAKSYNQADLQSEASDQICVNMTAGGASVEWTLAEQGDGLVVRYSVPDGQSGVLEVWTNGSMVGTLNLTTYYSWEYLCCNGNPNNGAVVNTNPKMRFDEVRMKLPSVIPAGGTLRLVRQSGNIHLDFAEMELVPAQVNASGGDVVYGGNGSDLQTFVYNNRGNTIYIPPGVYNVNEELYLGENNTTIKGAGSWYTQLHFTGGGSGDGGIRGNASNVNISGLFLTTVRNSRSNSYKGINGVFTPGTYITDVWAEHFEAGVWLGQYNSGSIGNVDGVTLSHCRFRNNYADGINFCKGTLNSICEHTNFRNNGDDDMAIWSANNQECRNNIFRYNTSENCWRASGCAIYGGYNNVAHHLLIKDNLEVGLRVNNEFPGAGFNSSGMHEFYEITLINCGTNNDLFYRPVGAIDIFCRNGAGTQVRNVRFADIDIIDSKNDAILINRFSGDGFYNLIFENIAINGTGVEYPHNDAESAGGQRGYGIKFEGNSNGYGTYCNITYANQGGNATGWENLNGIGAFSWTPQTGCASLDVGITSPLDGAYFNECDNSITITADASTTEGSVSKVEFFVDGGKIGEDNSAPYSFNWTTLTSGSHDITAVATASPSGSTETSSIVTISELKSIYPSSSSPTIDGTIDALWNNFAPVSIDKLSVGSTSGASDLSANFRMTRDAANLYVLVDVTDDDISNDGGFNWENDAVEVFIDFNNDKLSSYGATDFSYLFMVSDATVYEANDNTTGVVFNEGNKTGGYIMEVSIPWSTLGGVPSTDDLIGIDVHVNDDDGGGTRNAKIAWEDQTDNAWQNPSLFGTMKISSIPTESVTICSGSDYTFPDGSTQTNITSQTVHVSSLAGCGNLMETTVNVETPPTADAGPDQSIGADNTTLGATGSGTWTTTVGSGTITTPNDPSSTVTGLSTGMNTFVWTVLSGNTCPDATDEVDITYNSPTCGGITSAEAGPNQTECEGTTITLAANTPASGETGTWTGGSVSDPNDPNATLSGLPLGNTTLTWTITDDAALCTPTTSTVTITIEAAPTADAGPDQSIGVDNTTLAAIGSGIWATTVGSGTVTTPSDASSTVTGLSTGMNTFVWTVLSGNTCPDATDEVDITYNPPTCGGITSADAGPNQTECEGTTITLAANTPASGETGTWTGGTVSDPNDPNAMIAGLSAGNTTLTWTITDDAALCTPTTSTVTITIEAAPTADAGPDQSIGVDNTTLAATGSGIWATTVGSGTVTTPSDVSSTVTGLSTGTNTFVWTVLSGNTCPDATDEVDITYNPPTCTGITSADAGPNQTECEGTTITLAANTPASGETGTWTGGSVSDPNDPNATIAGLSAGNTTLTWTITDDAALCTPTTSTVTITIEATPTADAGPDQSIGVDNTTLAATGSGIWTTTVGSGAVTTPNDPSSTVTGLSTGINIFVWTVLSGNTCPDATDEVDITYNPPTCTGITSAEAGPNQTECEGTAITLAANIPASGETGTWTGGTVSDPNDPNATIAGLSAGNTTLTWTITDDAALCTPTTSTVTITIEAAPTADAGPDQSIGVDNTTLAATGSGIWTTTVGSGAVTTPNDPSSTVTGLSTGINTFVWTVLSGNTCPDATDEVDITYNPPTCTGITSADAGPNQTECEGTTITLAANIPASGETGTWTGGTVSDPNDPNATIAGLSAGNTTLTWTITDDAALCTPTTSTVTITIEAAPTADAGPNQSVSADNTTLDATGSGIWTTTVGSGAVTTPSDASSTVTGLSAGTNTFVWTVASGNTCPDATDEVDIVYTNILNADFTANRTEVCLSATVIFNSATAGASPSATYTWNFGAGATPSIAVGEGPHQVQYSSQGFKDVVLTVNDGVTDVESKSSFIQVVDVAATGPQITGPAWLSCNASGQTYSVAGQIGSTFSWNVFSGAILVSGQGTNSIVVDFTTNSGNLSVVEILANGCTSNTELYQVNLCVTSMEDLFSASEIKAFPNPFNDQIHIALQSEEFIEYTLLIYTVDGVQKLIGNYNSNDVVEIGEGFESGIYLAKMVVNDNVRTFKIVKY